VAVRWRLAEFPFPSCLVGCWVLVAESLAVVHRRVRLEINKMSVGNMLFLKFLI